MGAFRGGGAGGRTLGNVLVALVVFAVLLIAGYIEFKHLPTYSTISSYIFPCQNTTQLLLGPPSNTTISAIGNDSLPPTQIVHPAAPVFARWYANKTWHYPNRFPLCTMDTCFNFSRCDNMEKPLIYQYGHPFAPVRYLSQLESSPWYTSDPGKACLFLVCTDLSDPHKPHPRTLPYWNGGMNHLIATFADKWSQRNPPADTIGNASLLSSELHETTSRPGFDIAIPLPGNTHVPRLQGLKPFERKYFLTFKGVRYLGVGGEGTFRSHPSLKGMHNGRDIIMALACKHSTNDKLRIAYPWMGEGCDEDDERAGHYNFMDLMNATFCLAPAGRSPSSYRMIEVMSGGCIPVLICDNYVKPFDTLIQWHQCLLQFPTTEMHRIVPTLRALSKEEVEQRQKYCVFVYKEFLKDDKTLLRSVVRALKLRFYGVYANFTEMLPSTKAGMEKRRRLLR